jgi:hypothetical protein
VRDRVPILAIAVNPSSPIGPDIDPGALSERLGAAIPDIPVIDVGAAVECPSAR